MADESNSKDQDAATLLAVGIIIAVPIILWYVAHDVIVTLGLQIKTLQVQVLSYVIDPATLHPEGRYLRDGATLQEVVQYVKTGVSPSNVGFTEFWALTNSISQYTRWFWIGLLGAMMTGVMFRMGGNGYRRTFKLAPDDGGKKGGLTPPWKKKGDKPDLMTYQAEHWQVVKPVMATLDPEHPSANEQPQRTPLEWLRDINAYFTHKDGGLEGNREAWNKCLENVRQQLGSPLPRKRSGKNKEELPRIDKAPTYVRALVAIFALHGHEDETDFRHEISSIWATAPSMEKANEAIEERIQPVLRRDDVQRIIRGVARKHHFTATFLLGLLQWARTEGDALPPPEFRWLKAIDRYLWYALDNLGRGSNNNVGHVEGAGPIAHFNAERVAGQRLREPHTDEAVEGIAQYLREQGITDLAEFFRNEKKLTIYDPDDPPAPGEEVGHT